MSLFQPVAVFVIAFLGDETLTREYIAAVLRHREQLVQSIEAQLLKTSKPTDQEAIPRIKLVKGDDYKRYLYTDSKTEEIEWIFDQEKERWNIKFGGLSTTKAFDGNLVRAMLWEKNSGSIETVESAHWNNEIRLSPLSSFRHTTRAFSDIVANGSECSVSEVHQDGVARTRVFVRDPVESQTLAFALYFDRDVRLIARDMFFKVMGEQERLWERYDFSDFQDILLDSGEKLPFPMKAVSHHYCGTLPGGEHAEYRATVLETRSIRINPRLDDEMFGLEFPRSAVIWDGVNNLGLIRAADHPDLKSKSRRGRLVLLLVGNSVVVLLVICMFLWRSRKRKLLMSNRG